VLIVETAYYKNREGRLVDTGDKEVGFCFPSAIAGTDFDCVMKDIPDEHMLRAISLWCDTAVW